MEKFLFEYNEKNEQYVDSTKPLKDIGIHDSLLQKQKIGLPCISEGSLVRHFTRLSKKNFGVDNGFYPLGSCTMKYNPKINEKIATDPGFLLSHPLMDTDLVQGNLELLFKMEQFLIDISGMKAVTLQPVAGAHGEVTGIMLIRAYHNKNNNHNKKNIIVPDSSHGTNPATASVAGFNVIEIKSNKDGLVDVNALKEVLDDDTAALMLTNPNTLGLFEKDILSISKMVHDKGALLYYDGANLNPLLGRIRVADMGFDVVHFNLHKSFSTPHGGGGPGSGPVGVSERMESFLPTPVVIKDKDEYSLDNSRPDSIGSVHSFWGNFNVIIKAYFYCLELGVEGLRNVSGKAILNANYLKQKLHTLLELPYKQNCMHEFVLSGKSLNQYGLHTTDLAKRLIDYGYHPPTVYFPLIVDEAIMIEPVETESKTDLDRFADDFKKIIQEAKQQSDLLKNAPHNTPVKRLDEVTAARKPVLTFDEYESREK